MVRGHPSGLHGFIKHQFMLTVGSLSGHRTYTIRVNGERRLLVCLKHPGEYRLNLASPVYLRSLTPCVTSILSFQWTGQLAGNSFPDKDPDQLINRQKYVTLFPGFS